MKKPSTGAGKTIHFHVGAHKTATTYMQSRLRSNKPFLLQEGISFVDLWSKKPLKRKYRKRYKRLMESDVVDEKKLANLSNQLREIVEVSSGNTDSDIVVISYENILGNFDLTHGPGPYPNAQHAIRHLVEAFPDSHIRVFLSVRSLDRFLESGYVQLVLTRQETRRFRRYLSDVSVPELSWLPLVRKIESTIGQDNLTLWRYEDFRSQENSVWSQLLGRPNGEELLPMPAEKENHSLSAKGLKFMRSINKIATPADARKFRQFMKENFSPDQGFSRPRLLDDKMRANLVASYERDCQELSGRFTNDERICA